MRIDALLNPAPASRPSSPSTPPDRDLRTDFSGSSTFLEQHTHQPTWDAAPPSLTVPVVNAHDHLPERCSQTLFLARELSRIKAAMWDEAGHDHLRQTYSHELAYGALVQQESCAPSNIAAYSEYSTFCQLLDVPVYPITPPKAALCFSRLFPELPCTAYLPSGPGHTISYTIREAFSAMQTAARASVRYWNQSTSFVAGPEAYTVTLEVLRVAKEAAVASRLSQKRPRSDSIDFDATHRAPPRQPTPLLYPTNERKTFHAFFSDLGNRIAKLRSEKQDVELNESQHDQITGFVVRAYSDKKFRSVRSAYEDYSYTSFCAGIAPHPMKAEKLAIYILAFSDSTFGDTLRQLVPELRRTKRLKVDKIVGLVECLTLVQEMLLGEAYSRDDNHETRLWKEWRNEMLECLKSGRTNNGSNVRSEYSISNSRSSGSISTSMEYRPPLPVDLPPKASVLKVAPHQSPCRPRTPIIIPSPPTPPQERDSEPSPPPILPPRNPPPVPPILPSTDFCHASHSIALNRSRRVPSTLKMIEMKPLCQLQYRGHLMDRN